MMRRLILALAFCCIPAWTGLAQQSFPDFPPADVTREMDFMQMLGQMGMELPRLPDRESDPNRPEGSTAIEPGNPDSRYLYNGHDLNRSLFGLWDNYDDTAEGFFPGRDSWRVGDYTPISLTTMHDGKEIRTAEEWWNERRPEIVHDVQEALYGFFPDEDRLPSVSFSKLEFPGISNGRDYIQADIVGQIDISGYPGIRNRPMISATLRLPGNADKPVPLMIIISFGNMALDRYWEIFSEQGWGICLFSPAALQPDSGQYLTDYLIGLVNKGAWRKPDDWGTIGAWSWGISRLIDYLLTDGRIRPDGICLTGHSRYGKTALYTIAFDDRIRIGFPSDAGSLGTKMNRRHWGQDLENSAQPSEYHWMAGNFLRWCGPLVPGRYLPRKVEDCPVDAHSLLALCAPRPMFFNAGDSSLWSDPYGIYLTMEAATPVYRLLGHEGLVMDDPKPEVDKAYIEGDLGYRYHDGGHTDAPDWPAFFEFARKYLDN